MTEPTENGVLYRLLVIFMIGTILIVSVVSLGFILNAKATLAEVVTQQQQMQRGIALVAVIGTLAPSDQGKLFDMALMQVDPSLQPEIRRRVLIPGVPEVSPRIHAR